MALKNFAFKILSTDNYSRCGLIETHRGTIQTPAFMPVGTQATVKACNIEFLLLSSPIKLELGNVLA